VPGDGYIVEIILPAVVRYREPTRTLTFGCDPTSAYLGIYVETPVTWDNEEKEPLSQPEFDLIMSRIKAALAKKKFNVWIFYNEASDE
jgi:hypothetical protein